MNDEKKDALATYSPKTPANLPDAGNLRQLATELLASDFFKNIQKASQAVAIILYGAEIGLGPTASLQNIAIVNGKMCIATTVLQALFQKQGGRVKVIERSDQRAVVELIKNGWEPYKHEYTQKDAVAEGLWDKDGWRKRPKTMLLYRAISGGLRVYDPGSFMGVYTTEELEDNPGGFVEDKPTQTLPPAAAPEGGKPAKKGPGRPKAEKAGPEPSPEPEKPATAQPEAQPGEKDPGQSFGEEIGAEFKGEPTEEDRVIGEIKTALANQGVDEKAFKEWLLGHQAKMKPPRKFLIRWNKALRFHGGDLADLKYLARAAEPAVAMFRYANAAPVKE